MSNHIFNSKVGWQLAKKIDVHSIPKFKSVVKNTVWTMVTEKAIPWLHYDTPIQLHLHDSF